MLKNREDITEAIKRVFGDEFLKWVLLAGNAGYCFLRDGGIVPIVFVPEEDDKSTIRRIKFYSVKGVWQPPSGAEVMIADLYPK